MSCGNAGEYEDVFCAEAMHTNAAFIAACPVLLLHGHTPVSVKLKAMFQDVEHCIKPLLELDKMMHYSHLCVKLISQCCAAIHQGEKYHMGGGNKNTQLNECLIVNILTNIAN